MNDDDILAATRSNYCIGYRELPREAELVQVVRYCETMRRHFTPIAKAFTAEDNSRWLLRHYLAIKFAAAASLLAGSAQYAFERNLLTAVPYFNYYALLSACRAFLLTSPLLAWDGEKTVEMTHENILNRTAEAMRALDPDRRVAWRKEMADLRNRRELFSYRFPLSGPDFIGRDAFDPDRATRLTRLIAELAALNSECFDGVLSKHVGEEMPVVALPDHDWAEAYKLAGETESDAADRHRFGKLRRQWKTVSPLHVMTSDGLMDDLFGSWCDPDSIAGDEGFDPDDYSSYILWF